MTPYYDHDGITIYHGDCREVLPTLADSSIDMVLTDPPYGHNNNDGDLAHRWEEALGLVKRGEAVAGESRPIANDGPEASELVRAMFRECNRLLKPGCCCCCCCGGGGGPDPQFARWSLWLDEEIGFKHAVVWDKGGLGMGWHYRRNYELMLVGQRPGAACKWNGGNNTANVVRLNGIKPRVWDHPTPKPVSLFAHFVRLHSDKGDTVVDPFLGGGTSGVACFAGYRRMVGIEIDERFCEMSAKRIEATQRGITVKELECGQGTLWGEE